MKLNGLLLLAFVFPAMALANSAAPPFPTTIGSGNAVEGDVLSVNGGVVRLWGVDAPDKGQTCQNSHGQNYNCFEIARNVLSRLVGQNQVTCYVRGQDPHGQKLGTCAVQGMDLAALMVRDGWALSFESLSPQYTLLEGIAQARKRGLWAGRVLAPWLWRSQQIAEQRNK